MCLLLHYYLRPSTDDIWACQQSDQEIRSNDFMLAMLMRLGRIDESDMTKCRRLFSKLDR